MEDKFIFLDGAMGTTLQRRSLAPGGIPEMMNINSGDVIEKVHREFIEAGAEIIYSNTFGANRKKLSRWNLKPEEVIVPALKIGRRAAGDKLVALDIGPIGEMMAPIGTLDFEEAYDLFQEQVLAGRDFADLIVIETMADLGEVKAAILAAKEHSNLPVFVTMTFEKDGRTFSGTNVSSFGALAEGLGVDALGVNCSLGPKEIYPIIKKLSETTTTDLIVKANAGLPNFYGEYELTPEEFGNEMYEISKLGVKYLGGCCGTDPQYIRTLKEKCKGMVPKGNRQKIYAVASPTRFTRLDSFCIVGERINPTGKKKLAQSLKDNSMEEVLSMAVAQKEEGAEILDINMGLPNVDEKALMERAVTELTGIPDLPLQLDSSKPHVLEGGLRKYPGIPIVNSVNGTKESLEKILPLVKKYGAFVIGLTLDEHGIPKDVEGRVEIGKNIAKACIDNGIPKEKIIIDPLALTISSSPESGKIALETLQEIKKLGLKTTLGVSNISFGLPERERVTAAFLQQALLMGLDLPIVNPGDERIQEVIATHRLLQGMDPNGEKYIKKYGKQKREAPKPVKDQGFLNPYDAMTKGQKEDLVEFVKLRLEDCSPMDIIDEDLIPALDHVGEDYEKGNIYLPQLITAAATAQKAFSHLHKVLGGELTGRDKGKILLATVEGDVHDIGKNIVKVILQNYGYRIFDLGKDVSPERILETAREENISLVGLSALMTTTVESMERTIDLLKEKLPQVKVMVGGAVLTKEIATEIGADYYVADAKEDILVAQKVYRREE
ncbi:MAG: homocysteine S-methyltransferase family protein [Tissierellia bacterium]|nr:homocysteine S-methyltransferase family protein [Tissierellia bacterium]